MKATFYCVLCGVETVKGWGAEVEGYRVCPGCVSWANQNDEDFTLEDRVREETEGWDQETGLG